MDRLWLFLASAVVSELFLSVGKNKGETNDTHATHPQRSQQCRLER